MNEGANRDHTPLAWQISDRDEGRGVIAFHHHGLAAKRLGADALGLEFESCDSVRVPHFDDYAAQGRVPPKVLLAHGWWFECRYCGHHVMTEERDDEANTPLDAVIEVGDGVYCNVSCQAAHENQKRERNDAFAAFKQRVQSMRPDLTFTEFRGGYPYCGNRARFTFPGAQYGGQVIDDNGALDWRVREVDLAAWASHEASRTD